MMDLSISKLFTVLIPFYNEEATIADVMASIEAIKPKQIVMVDDGSTDNSAELVRQYSKISQVPVILLSNKQNRGTGYSLSRGFAYCRSHECEYVLTVDADNQHSVNDVVKIMRHTYYSNKDLIVTGIRDFDKHIPQSKKLTNFLAKMTFRVLYGIVYRDPLSGLRCYKYDILHELTLEDGFDWVITVNRLIRKNRSFCSFVDIQAIYSAYSMEKGQTLRSGFFMGISMLKSRLKESLPTGTFFSRKVQS